MPLECIDASEEALLVTDIVPGRVEPAFAKAIVKERHRAQCSGTLLIDHADVDTLVEAELEIAAADLLHARLPLVRHLTKEVIVGYGDAWAIHRPIPDAVPILDPVVPFSLVGHKTRTVRPFLA